MAIIIIVIGKDYVSLIFIPMQQLLNLPGRRKKNYIVNTIENFKVCKWKENIFLVQVYFCG